MRSLIKSIIPSNSGLFKFLSKSYRSLFKIWLPANMPVDDVLKKYAIKNLSVFFIQIGSNDGISNDPIHKYIIDYKWKGILVEPVKFLFAKLKSNYINNQSQLVFENAAISNKDGKAIFYSIRESDDPNTPFWYSQIGSFNKNVLLSHKDSGDFENLIIAEEINAISFATLLAKHNVDKVDLVHIDTEGFDFEILKLIDFKKLNLNVVIYEYVHLSLTDFIKSLRLMKANGFYVFASNLDIICIKRTLKL